jgi:hypothetical protein
VSALIIDSEGLLRLVGLVERLRARDSGEGDAPWTAPTRTNTPDPRPGSGRAGAVEVAAGVESAGGAQDAEHAAGAVGGGPDEQRERR